MSDQPPGQTVVFYDGVCGLCNRFVWFVLRRDRQKRIQFAPLQGELARTALAGHDRDAAHLQTLYVIADWSSPRARLLDRSRAVLHVLRQLDCRWRWAARVASLIPLPLADAVYGVIARVRYSLFGRLPACPLPPAEWRERFLECGPD
ncbi:MAG: DCC1-like thiol-disulfide oxidoreductase family protein [Acidobacteria bacterium]|nr:DCC1-like thiol-disulfide oxidoreductase family protein [Acidobacteriota bacterium]MCA1651201.1 DCC1-like thiol-disulfide oxidoreductase family protein [Acidobacteriota bacterium]